VQARLVERVRRRPPRSDLVLDVRVENPSAAARWCILPAKLPVPEEGGIFGVEVSLLGGEGRVPIGRLLGRLASYALLLPPGARIRLRELVVAAWGELEPPIRLDVALASRALLGAEDLLVWFPHDPGCDVEADVGAPVDLLCARSTQGLAERPLVLQEATTERLDVVA
jgi:hypothetical protein